MTSSEGHKRLSANDVEELRDLLRICWLDTYTDILPDSAIKTAISQWQSKESLLRGLQNPRAYYAGYVMDDILVGMISAGKIAPDTVKIFQLYVRPGQQRKGIGKELMDGAISHFGNDAIRRVVLEVEEGNQKGISFYRKYGFAYPSKTVVKVDGNEIPCLVGELLLRQ